MRRIRNVVTSVELPIGAGFVEPRENTYCQFIVDGQLDEVIVDVAGNPLVNGLPITEALGIASYIGVPVHRKNGQLYGTLCAFSQTVDEAVRQRDTEVLRAIATVVMDLVEIEDRSEEDRYQVLERLDRLHADGGPNIVYQTIHSLTGLEATGVEALSRFPPGSGRPDEWFSSASRAGVGVKLELSALRNALRILPALKGYLALNVSPATVLSPGFSRLMCALPLDRIVIEITEHEAIEDYDALTAVLKPLRENGLRLSVDDAGAGFASMRHVLAFMPEFIKLDISLVRGVDTDPARQALATALAAFASKTGSCVIAEGIETAGELECLRSMDIACGQGYHLSLPGPVADDLVADRLLMAGLLADDLLDDDLLLDDLAKEDSGQRSL
jgi:EAL domain-containing protein (putative c-di-GMP-specific phosphodiesterase class I)